uniref:Uncharacterized protein n=1 Tax=Arundo donax TaxID=35708 RepID=A0A0A9DB58_ARUDO
MRPFCGAGSARRVPRNVLAAAATDEAMAPPRSPLLPVC